MKTLHGDNGIEVTRAFKTLKNKGVEIKTTPSYTPELIELVERTQIVILSNIRSYIIQSKLSKSYCNDTLRHVMHCRNELPHNTTKKTAFELVFEKCSTVVVI